MEGKLARYFKYGKINKYLKSRDESQYNVLDQILKCYVDGHLKELLNSYQFSEIEYYPLISKRGNLLQIDFWYQNLHINIEFDVDNYDYIIYKPGISAEEFANGIITKEYDCDFNIEKFFENFYNMLQKVPKLSNDDFRKKRKVNIFKIIKLSILSATLLAFSFLVVYVFFCKSSVYLGVWGCIGLALIIGLYFVLDYFQKRKK